MTTAGNTQHHKGGIMNVSRLTEDREGNPWKVYPSGKILCARTRPFHTPMGTNPDRCDCAERHGETIATLHFYPRGEA